jgi:hypothetical protein
MDAINVVMPDALQPAFTEWLESRGLVLNKQPWAKDDPEELDTWFVSPSRETWDSVVKHM